VPARTALTMAVPTSVTNCFSLSPRFLNDGTSSSAARAGRAASTAVAVSSIAPMRKEALIASSSWWQREASPCFFLRIFAASIRPRQEEDRCRPPFLLQHACHAGPGGLVAARAPGDQRAHVAGERVAGRGQRQDDGPSGHGSGPRVTAIDPT